MRRLREAVAGWGRSEALPGLFLALVVGWLIWSLVYDELHPCTRWEHRSDHHVQVWTGGAPGQGRPIEAHADIDECAERAP